MCRELVLHRSRWFSLSLGYLEMYQRLGCVLGVAHGRIQQSGGGLTELGPQWATRSEFTRETGPPEIRSCSDRRFRLIRSGLGFYFFTNIGLPRDARVPLSLHRSGIFARPRFCNSTEEECCKWGIQIHELARFMKVDLSAHRSSVRRCKRSLIHSKGQLRSRLSFSGWIIILL